ncbi:hypothetical protein [Amycolatopsis silviterrae]|uniref:Uncharacterized protein n=1 Tax=Amycolatopsis silviterrae TaxID=1656914 RepID=A0ABW5GZ80_9PSEU
MGVVLLGLAGSSAVTAIAWMVVRLADARTLKQMMFKSIEDCPPAKRPATIEAVSQLASQMSRERPLTGTGHISGRRHAK